MMCFSFATLVVVSSAVFGIIALAFWTVLMAWEEAGKA